MIKKYLQKSIINRKLCICKNKLKQKINFGNLPIVNNYTSKINLKKYPVIISQCEKCQLIHLKYTLPDKLLFPSNYSYLSGNSKEKIDNFNKELSSLNSFILPGGSESSTYLHIARTVTRRAERKIVALSKKEKINPITIIYLNRLSDLLFVLARYTNNKGKKDILWKPGKNLKKS